MTLQRITAVLALLPATDQVWALGPGPGPGLGFSGVGSGVISSPHAKVKRTINADTNNLKACFMAFVFCRLGQMYAFALSYGIDKSRQM